MKAFPGYHVPASRVFAESLLVLAVCILAHYALYGGTGQWLDNDAPFHQRVIADLWQDGPWRDITWLPYTILRDAGPDQHWLWHLLLAPFASISDLGTRIDLMNAFAFALVPTSTHLALRLFGVRAAPFWTLLVLAVTFPIVFRWSQARAQNIAYVYLALFLVALAARHRIALAVIAFLFMNSYHGAAMIAAPALLMFGVRAWRDGTRQWDLLVLPAVGGLVALVTSPWYPHNIEYFLFHTLDKVGNSLSLDVGLEWYPLDPSSLARRVLPQLAVLAVVLAGARDCLRSGLSDIALVALGTALFFLVLALQHGRFAEYCPQTLILAAALVARDAGNRFGPAQVRRPFLATAAVAAATVFVLSTIAEREIHRADPSLPLDRDAQVGRFLTAHTHPGDLICNTQWDDFPFLVFNAPGLRYLTGLDPYYLAYGDEKRFVALAQLNEYARLAPGATINVRTTFGCDWVVTPRSSIVGHLLHTQQARAVLMNRYHFLVYVGDDKALLSRLPADATGDIRWLLPRR